MSQFVPPVTRRALGDISNHASGNDAKASKAAQKPSTTNKISSHTTDAPKTTIGGLNPQKTLAGIDSSLHAAKLTDGATADVTPDVVDMPDAHNAQCAVPHIKDIMRCLRDTEDKYLAPPNYMSQQTDINEKMRAILVDWLIEVHLKFKLVSETMFITVALIDRFLAKKSIMRNKLQLVGVTAMLIASKYEDIYAPLVRDFVYISDKAYSREEILTMEGTMLAVLNFNVTAPSAYAFLKRFAKVAGFAARPGKAEEGSLPHESRGERLCAYLVELTLQEYRMLKYLPSVVAASAVLLAQKMLRTGSWDSVMQQHTCYPEASLLPCVRDIVAIAKATPTNSLSAVRKKYSQEKYGAVAQIPIVGV